MKIGVLCAALLFSVSLCGCQNTIFGSSSIFETNSNNGSADGYGAYGPYCTERPSPEDVLVGQCLDVLDDGRSFFTTGWGCFLTHVDGAEAGETYRFQLREARIFIANNELPFRLDESIVTDVTLASHLQEGERLFVIPTIAEIWNGASNQLESVECFWGRIIERNGVFYPETESQERLDDSEWLSELLGDPTNLRVSYADTEWLNADYEHSSVAETGDKVVFYKQAIHKEIVYS